MKKWLVILSVAMMATFSVHAPAHPETKGSGFLVHGSWFKTRNQKPETRLMVPGSKPETRNHKLETGSAEELEIAKKIAVLEAELAAAKRENAAKDAEIARLKRGVYLASTQENIPGLFAPARKLESGLSLRSLLARQGPASPRLMAQAAEEAQPPEEGGSFEERLLGMGTEGGVEGADPLRELMRYERGQIKYQILQFIPPLLQSALVGDAFILPPGAFRVVPANRFVRVGSDDFFKDGSRLPGFEKFKVKRNFIDLGLFYGFDLNRKYLHSFTAFLNIPYLSSRADGFINPNGVRGLDVINQGSSLEVGDISLIVKKKLLDQANSPIQLAAAAGVFFPTGSHNEKFGDNGRVSVRAPRFPLLGLTAPPVGVPIPTKFLQNLGRGTGAFPFNDGVFNRFSDDGRLPTPLQPGTGRFSYFLGAFLTRQFVPGNFALLGGWPGRAAFHAGYVHRLNFAKDGIDPGDFGTAFASLVKPFYKDYLSFEIASVNFIQEGDRYRGRFIAPFNTKVNGEPAVVFREVERSSFNRGWTSMIVPSLILSVDPQIRLAVSALFRVHEPEAGPAPDSVLRLELTTTFALPGILGGEY